jgi:hypothetical protein
VSDPRAARQFGAFGSLLIWRDAAGGGAGPRRGLLCVPDVCTNPTCFAVHIWLGEVDATMASVSKSGTAFEFVLDADRSGDGARMPLSDAFANYDTEAGTLAPTEGHEKSPLVKWLLASADADVLTHLRTPLMQRELAAGRVMKKRSAGG